jgi:hypothetical protein
MFLNLATETQRHSAKDERGTRNDEGRGKDNASFL